MTGKVKSFNKKTLMEKSGFSNIYTELTRKEMQQAPKVLYKKTVQDSIPIVAVHEKENLIETYPGFFTRSYWIKENNYQSETEEREEGMYIDYRKVLNSLGTNEEYSVSIMNRNVNMREIEENVLCKETGDELDYLRLEMNDVTLERINQGRNGLQKLKYITIGLHCKELKKAADVFDKSIDRRMSERFKKIESDAVPIPIERKLEILHDIYNIDEQGTFLSHKKVQNSKTGMIEDVAEFDFENMRAQGCQVADIIGPSSFCVHDSYIEMGRKFVRTLRLEKYPATMGDDFFCKLTDVDFNILTTANIKPIPATLARKIVSRNLKLARAEMSEQRQALIRSNLPEEMVSDETRDNVDRAKELRDDMVKNDERLFKTCYTITFWADSLEELQEHTETIMTTCQTEGAAAQIMTKMQEEGFNYTLPLCDDELPYRFKRTLKSSSAAIFFPFSNLELMDKGGINYSCNLYSKNLIVYDRTQTQNYNGFVLGKPGSGKSLASKVEMLSVMLGSNSDCIVIDPEGEYGALARLIHGQEIKIEPGGKWHINPMEIDTRYEWESDDEDMVEPNPVYAKCTFIIRLIETMLDSPLGISAVQKTIVDESVRTLYKPWMREDGGLDPIPADKMPTLVDLQKEFARHARIVPEARELEYCLKLYTEGSLNAFSYRSNVDVHNRFITYNIRDVGEELMPLAMMIILDSLFTTMFRNKRAGKFTWTWIDEIYLMFKSEKSAGTLNELFKRSRKHGGIPTGITQNIEDLLESNTARKMLSNCNFVMILNQSPSDREHLRDLLNLSQSQVEVITSAPKGQGLIYTGDHVVPFYSVFPKNNSIYRCLTSNMKEIREYEEEDRRKKALELKSEKKRSLVGA